jgi:hypothetical protein
MALFGDCEAKEVGPLSAYDLTDDPKMALRSRFMTSPGLLGALLGATSILKPYW